MEYLGLRWMLSDFGFSGRCGLSGSLQLRGLWAHLSEAIGHHIDSNWSRRTGSRVDQFACPLVKKDSQVEFFLLCLLHLLPFLLVVPTPASILLLFARSFLLPLFLLSIPSFFYLPPTPCFKHPGILKTELDWLRLAQVLFVCLVYFWHLSSAL